MRNTFFASTPFSQKRFLSYSRLPLFLRNGMHQMHPMQIGGGGNSGPQSPQAHNNWGCLDDLVGVGYGQPPLGHMMGVPPGMSQPRRSMTSAGFGQQQSQQMGGMGRSQQPQSHFASMTSQQQQQNQFLMGRAASQGCYGNSGGWSSPSHSNWSPGPPGSGWSQRGPMNNLSGRGSGMSGPGPAAMAAATAAAMAQRTKLFGSGSAAGFPPGHQYVQNRFALPFEIFKLSELDPPMGSICQDTKNSKYN